MCGITGWVAFSQDMTRERNLIDATTETMVSRGLDAGGVWSEPNATLGHRRLAVIDLAGGVEPMTVSTPNGDVVIGYSGEAYNFTELRSELIARGAKFGTSSDAEVLLWHLHRSEAVVDRLNGMNTFPIWDARERERVMSRDRIGVELLYLNPTADGVLFVPEPKATLANPLAHRTVDVAGLRELSVLIKTTGNAIAECVLLSGGLDSSAITGLSARALDGHVRTCAVGLTRGEASPQANRIHLTRDAPFVHDVADLVSAHYSDIMLDHNELALDLRHKVVGARDLPSSAGERDAWLYLLFKAIRPRSAVALSDETADEVSGGYRWLHVPRVQQADAFPWIATGHPMFDGPADLITPQARAAVDLETYLHDSYTDAVGEVARLDGEDNFTHRMRVISYLHLTRFVRILLDRKDRMIAAVDLEARDPLCDYRLIEYVYNTPPLKTCGGRKMSLPRGATRDVLSPSAVERIRSQYPSTADRNYGATLQQQTKDVLGASNDVLFEVLDRAAVEQLPRLNPQTLPDQVNVRLERMFDMAVWLDIYRPESTFETPGPTPRMAAATHGRPAWRRFSHVWRSPTQLNIDTRYICQFCNGRGLKVGQVHSPVAPILAHCEPATDSNSSFHTGVLNNGVVQHAAGNQTDLAVDLPSANA